MAIESRMSSVDSVALQRVPWAHCSTKPHRDYSDGSGFGWDARLLSAYEILANNVRSGARASRCSNHRSSLISFIRELDSRDSNSEIIKISSMRYHYDIISKRLLSDSYWEILIERYLRDYWAILIKRWFIKRFSWRDD